MSVLTRAWPLAAAATLLASCASVPTPAPQASAALAPSDEVFYHVFNRSLRDSDGDGHGDLQGIIDSLDYLKELGVTSILLTPLYPSAFYHNYFASDFEGIDPEYGTMEDYHRLVAEVHKRGMKIYLDQEIQYVAYDHPWYTQSLGNPASPYSDFLVWRGPGNTQPDEGPFAIVVAKHWPDLETGITTLNMESPELKAYFDRYFLSWVDPNGDGDFSDGVDGFRIDHMMDNLDERDMHTNLFAEFWRPLFDKVRAVNPQVIFIAEQSDWGYGEDFLTRGDADYVFAFPLREAIRSFDKAKIVEAIRGTANATPQGKHQLIFIENHDMNRVASDEGMTPTRLRTAAALGILLQGTPLLYYGQELGMHGVQDMRFETDEKDIGIREAFEWEAEVEAPIHANWYRDPSKSYWTDKYSQSHDGISVEEQDGDPDSLLNFYRRLLDLRTKHPALSRGSLEVMESAPELLVVERKLDGERFHLVANLSDRMVNYQGPGQADLLGGSGRALAPYDIALFKLN
ncbi:alpha-amylase family glycosyl hydrolase [Pelagerythrobacter aerophilus]|nr:alpha-amylase family glycosyl hydrolase [Pelagerythrobacter aerophilus]